MSDTAATAEADGIAGRGRKALTHDGIERILGDFRDWLEKSAQCDSPIAEPDDEPAIDLATLVGAFAALRHDVSLQTKAARAQSEQTATALGLLDVAVGNSAESRSDDELLNSLIEAADALIRSRQGLERALTGSAAVAAGWRGWFGRGDAARPLRSALESAGEGLALASQRLDRSLEKHGMEIVPSLGEPFDPETMEALDVVAGLEDKAGIVIEEVRRGYLRDGAVFRTALVKVAR